MRTSPDRLPGCRDRTRRLLARILIALACITPLSALQVLRMELPELCQRADRIFRGEVLDVRTGTVEVGGGTLPTVTYRLRVADPLKGHFPRNRKGRRLVELTMLGSLKQQPAGPGGVQHLSVLPRLPTLERGQHYLLLTTRPSAIGLCAPVGLEQGAFRIEREDDHEVAIDGLGQRFSYTELQARIRDSLEAS